MKHQRVMSCLNKLVQDVDSSTELLEKCLLQLNTLAILQPNNNEAAILIASVKNQIKNNLNKK